jgi:hypothetical protein
MFFAVVTVPTGLPPSSARERTYPAREIVRRPDSQIAEFDRVAGADDPLIALAPLAVYLAVRLGICDGHREL